MHTIIVKINITIIDVDKMERYFDVNAIAKVEFITHILLVIMIEKLN